MTQTRYQMTDDEVSAAYKMLHKYALRLGVNDNDRDDVVQSALVTYVRTYGRIKSEYRTLALRRALVDACRSHWVRVDREPALGAIIEDGNDRVLSGALTSGDVFGTDKACEYDVSVRQLDRKRARAHDIARSTRDPLALFEEAGLTEHQAEISLLTMDGLTARQIGELLGIAPGTVHAIRNHVRAKLRKILD